MKEPEKSAALSSYERSLVTKLADNPMELFAGRTVGWLEDFIRITVGIGPGNPSGGIVSGGRHVTGHYAWIAKDLTLFTAEYVYEDASGEYLYCNGAYVNMVQYADLYTYYGPNAYGPDTGTHFMLPDARGRAAFFCGTHANTDLGDNDGVAVTSRQVYHQHAVTVSSLSASTNNVSAGTPSGSVSVSVTGASAGTPAGSVSITDPEHYHSSYGGSNFQRAADPVEQTHIFTHGLTADSGDAISRTSPTGITASFTGSALGSHGHTASGSFTGSALSTHGHSVSGTGSGSAGSGMSSDGPAHIFLGSLVVRF